MLLREFKSMSTRSHVKEDSENERVDELLN